MTLHSPSFTLVDCTIRDGGYVNDFQLTKEHVTAIILAAEKAGIELIEIGHGLGVSAFRQVKSALLSDLDYCHVAKEQLSSSKWGTFCIAHWAHADDLNHILALEPDFLKIGVDPDQIQPALDIAVRTASTRTRPILFMMKTYAWSEQQLQEFARHARECGAHELYIVDSAGTMLPQTVSDLVKRCQDYTDGLPIGFHGHNNLGLAVSNTVQAILSGATRIDSSMLGIGRSGGNCCTEQLLCVLNKMGITHRYDLTSLLAFSEHTMPHIMQPNRTQAVDIVMGAEGFHSSFLSLLENHPSTQHFPMTQVIPRICRLTKLKPSDAQIREVAEQLEDTVTA